ncbi:diguanylate cyclase domain-containing protein [Pseudazoarcus pumilus]|uniref:GGDEF domain-containing protein n=1 Tax=Pseudazoarcus pumilus TaxID=2067960 RepID=A0A2I6S7U5_9RHOO|nr:diguanylate cyclase [Pseudazoarcus pumilus]AUN95334.1 hypothetical protein C0099_10585 [Pseudazoarcus pumilus]
MRFSVTITNNRTQWLLLSVVLISFASLIAASLFYERSRVIEEQRQRLITKARVVDENIVRQLEGVRNGLQSILADLEYFDHFKARQHLLGLRLKALSDAMPGVRTLNVLDASGTVIASNRAELAGKNFADRQYFTMLTQTPDPGDLYLSQPFASVLGAYSMNLVQVSTNEGGAIERVVTATLDPEFFQVLLSSVRFADDVWVALAHVKGVLALHLPERRDLLGVDLNTPGSLFRQHVDGAEPSSFLTGPVKTTGENAWMAQRTITAPHLRMRGALVVAAARSADRALEPWDQIAKLGLGVVALVSLISAVTLWQTQRNRARAMAVLAHEEALRHQAEQEVRQMAFYDALTHLPNRRLLLDRMSQQQAASVRHGRYSALLFLDLDGFKQLNDRHGHDRGDRLLEQVAQRLQGEIRQEDTAARWAGDEFIVMLSELSGDAEDASQRAAQVAAKILASLAREYDLDGLAYRCTASMGVALFGGEKEPLDEIIKRADKAMYQAKASGRNAFASAAPG